MRRLAVLAFLVLIAAPGAADAAAPCLGDLSAAGVAATPGPPKLRLRLNPAGEAGRLRPDGPPPPPAPAPSPPPPQHAPPQGPPPPPPREPLCLAGAPAALATR